MQRFVSLCAFAALLILATTGTAVGQAADTFTVTVADRSAEHPYQDGYPEVYVVDGVQGKEMVLEKGETYLFQMDNVPSFHPFYLTTSSVGLGGEQYDDGVDGNGASGSDQLTFTPPTNAPDSLWYQCTNHRKMGWRMALVEASARASVEGDGEVSFGDTGIRIDFAGTTGSGEVRVSKFNSAPHGTEGINESTVSEYRFAVRAGGDLSVGGSTEVRFDVETLAGVGDASNVTVYRRDSTGTGSFASLETTYDSSTNELVVATDQFSEFVFASDSEPLPVELAGFEGRVDGRTVNLTWRTTSETNNAGFEIQRSARKGGERTSSWTRVGFVESEARGSESETKYRFEDDTPPFEADRVRYRLKQVDVDGSASLSDPVTVAFDDPSRIALSAPYPNPATKSVTIRYELPRAKDVHLSLYNVLGQQVTTLTAGQESAGRKEVQFDVPAVASGTYIVRLVVGTKVRTRKMTIVR